MIPKIIHQMWKTNSIPNNLFELLKQVKLHHLDWIFYFWTDDTMFYFIQRNYPHYLTLFIEFPCNIQRCDFFKYIVLYHYGGFYFDLDIIIFKNINSLLINDICLFNEITITNDICIANDLNINECDRVANYAFGSIPNHWFILQVIKHINIGNNSVNYRNDIFNTTGSNMFTTLYYRYNPCQLIYAKQAIHNDFLCKCNNYNSCRVGDFGSHLHLNSWNDLSENANMYLILNSAISKLNIKMATPEYQYEIINYMLAVNSVGFKRCYNNIG